jgi:hypothetical protein
MTGTDYTLFTHKSIPVIFESPCITAEREDSQRLLVLRLLLNNYHVPETSSRVKFLQKTDSGSG